MLMSSKTLQPCRFTAIGCNILVYDEDAQALALVKSIAANGKLVKPSKNKAEILGLIQNTDFSDTDICAIFLTEESDENGLSGFEIVKLIQQVRSSIPIFMRLVDQRGINDLTSEQRNYITGCYRAAEPETLKKYTDKFLYGLYFPNALVNIFVESGLTVLNTAFKGCEVKESQPFLVFDHMITTEYTSILPVQFSFGNGVLTFSMKDHDAVELIENEHTALNIDQTSSKHLNQLNSEVMNLFWGMVRLHCDRTFAQAQHNAVINIPIVVDHKNKSISFGNNSPQLCFRYVIVRDVSVPEPFIVEFKMIFNSILEPRDFPDRTSMDPLRNEDGSFEAF